MTQQNMFDHGKIVPVNIREEMKRSYIDYAMSVIVGRALPDVRDGLKPDHRRILYAINELGMYPDKPFIWQTLGNFSPGRQLLIKIPPIIRIEVVVVYIPRLVDHHHAVDIGIQQNRFPDNIGHDPVILQKASVIYLVPAAQGFRKIIVYHI